MSQTGTHPVYVDRGLKKDVESASVDEDTTMKEIMERLIVRGMAEGFHETPLPKAFDDALDDVQNDLRSASEDSDYDHLSDRVDRVRSELEDANLRDDDEAERLLERCDELQEQIDEQTE